ncbi:MAG: hypothetical protein WBG86_03240 [Polyangiales bacterium]
MNRDPQDQHSKTNDASPGGDLKGELARTASDLKDEGRSLADTAAQTAREKTRESYYRGRNDVQRRLGGVASALQAAAQDLESGEGDLIGTAVGRAADEVERLSNALGGREIGDLKAEAEGLARRHPAVFLGAAFGFGVLVGRFLTSSASRTTDARSALPTTGHPSPGATLQADAPENARAAALPTGERNASTSVTDDVG